MKRHLRLELEGMVDPVVHEGLVPVRREQAESLAVLMLEAYRGTIDATGDETLDDARRELDRYFAHAPCLDLSFACETADGCIAASLVARPGDTPFVAYLMTHARHKRRGLARTLLVHCAGAAAGAGYRRLDLWVTRGNLPAERLYAELGFAELET